jgi:hypothetical protein
MGRLDVHQMYRTVFSTRPKLTDNPVLVLSHEFDRHVHLAYARLLCDMQKNGNREARHECHAALHGSSMNEL